MKSILTIGVLTLGFLLTPGAPVRAAAPANVGGPCPALDPNLQVANADDYAQLWCFISNNNVLNKNNPTPKKHIVLYLKAASYTWDKQALPVIKGWVTVVGAGPELTFISGPCPPWMKTPFPNSDWFETLTPYEECSGIAEKESPVFVVENGRAPGPSPCDDPGRSIGRPPEA